MKIFIGEKMRTFYQGKLSIHQDKYGFGIYLDFSFYLPIGNFLLIF